MVEQRELPRLTIITVHLERPSGLERTLLSVREQTYPQTKLQHLLVDGGSTESTISLLERYRDGLSWWVSEPDGGVFEAMNKALRRAEGQWIHFLNAGDTYPRTTTLIETVARLSETRDVVFGEVLEVRSNGFLHPWYQPSALWSWGLFRNVCHQAIFYSRRVLREREFESSTFNFSADSDLNLRLALELPARRIEKIDLSVAVYERGGLSDRNAESVLAERGVQFRRHLSGWRYGWNRINLFRQMMKRRMKVWRRRKPPRLLVLSLRRRGGSVLYAREVIDRLDLPKVVLVSAHSREVRPRDADAQATYRSRVGFVFASLTRLPVLAGRLALGLLAGRYAALYLPAFHFWNLPVIALCRLFGVRTILTEHDGLPLPGEGWPFEGWLRRLSARLAARRIFLSEFVRDQFSVDCSGRGSDFVVPLGLLTHGGLQEDPRQHPGRALRVLFLGRVTHRKGIDRLLDATARLPSEVVERLTIAGEPGDLGEVQTSDLRVGWKSRWLDDTEIADLVRDHDVLVLPYRHASQSGVATIGIAGAIPMICTRVGGLEEQLAASESLFVESESRDIAAAIRLLASDADLYESLSSALANRRRRSSWSEIAARVQHIITRVDCAELTDSWQLSERA